MIISAKNFIIQCMNIIELENVRFRYGKQNGKNVIDGVSLSVREGEFVAVIGHNGSGKSTLAKLLNGLLTPTEGKVTIDGKSTLDDDSIYEIRKTVGVVFQNPDNQMVATIIEDDVAFGPENIGCSSEEIGRRIDWALKSVDMEQYRRREPFKLSGGQKQRVAIAGILAIKPRVLVLDEATAMLDPPGREEIMRVVSALRKQTGMTVITITHFMDEASDADRVIVLNDGKIYLDGTPAEVFSHRTELEKAGLVPPLYERVKAGIEDVLPEVKDATDEDMLVDILCR